MDPSLTADAIGRQQYGEAIGDGVGDEAVDYTVATVVAYGASIAGRAILDWLAGRAAKRALTGAGECVAARGGGRGANNLKPDPNATGPHSTWKTDADGNITGHAEWKPNPQNPSGFDQAKRVDTQHANPHTHHNKATGEAVPVLVKQVHRGNP